MNANAVPRRESWLVILFAMTAAPVVYYFVAGAVAEGIPDSPVYAMLLPAFGMLAAVELALGAFVLSRAPRAGSGGLPALLAGAELATPQAFQTASVIGMALAEACAILGFVLVFVGGPVYMYVPFGAASVAVMLAVGLPAGLGYWRDRAQADAEGRAPIE